MRAMPLIVVPANTWHRFDTPDGARIMTTTPQPTEYRVEEPTELS